MSTHKNINIICVVVMIFALIITVLFMNGSSLGITTIVDEDTEANEDSQYYTANDVNGDWDTSEATFITLEDDSATISGSGAYFYDGTLVIAQSGYYVISGSLSDGNISVDAYENSKVWIMLNGVDIYCSDDACIRVEEADKVFLTLAEDTVNNLESGEEYSDEAIDDGTGGVIYAHDDITINGSGTLNITASYKHGIEANDDLVIASGTINITCPEDGIHVNDRTVFVNADVTIDAGDDGVHSTDEIDYLDGTLLITNCYEGLESAAINVFDGEITIYPTDDGFNATSGSAESGFSMGGGMQMSHDENSDFSPADMENSSEDSDDNNNDNSDSQESDNEADSEKLNNDTAEASDEGEDEENDEDEDEDDDLPYINIEGGTIIIINENAQDADGLDSNGDITISGGFVYISLVNSGTNNAIDYGSESGGVCTVTGGTVIAAGGYSMAEGFDSTSTQASFMYTISDGVEAETEIILEDEDGNVILSQVIDCSFSALTISCPEMEVGNTYYLVIGEDSDEITLDEVSASFGDAQSSMFGGTMNWGGMGNANDRRGGGRMSESDSTDSDSDDTSSDQDSMPTDGEMPDMGEMPTDGEMPEMGEKPDMNQQTSNDESTDEASENESTDSVIKSADSETAEDSAESSENQDHPSMDESSSEHNMGPDMMNSSEAKEDTVEESTFTSLSDIDDEVWMWLGACIIALILGIIFAKLYGRRH